MIRPSAVLLLIVLVGVATPAVAQSPLTLADAIGRARAQNPDVGSSTAAEQEAEQRVTQARASYLPKVDLLGSWQRGNQPVFVFSSLLSQRQFTAADFGLDALNHPAPIDNVRSAVAVEQPVFDASSRANVAAARMTRAIATVNRQALDLDLAAKVTAAYGRVLIATATNRSATAAVETVRADRELAGHRRDAGLATDADALQVDLYVSRAREQQIRATSEERIARAQLNQLMGEPLGTAFLLELLAPLPDAPAFDDTALGSLEAEAIANRPDVKRAALQEQLAGTAKAAARAAFLPEVRVQGGWEFNGGTWTTLTSSWVVGATARINLFNGFADTARRAEARELATRRALELKSAETAARLDVYTAVARLDAARASDLVGRTAVAQAHESQRIIRDRYEAGLADVASLLRAVEAVAQAETQEVTARVAVLTDAAALARTLGRR